MPPQEQTVSLTHRPSGSKAIPALLPPEFTASLKENLITSCTGISTKKSTAYSLPRPRTMQNTEVQPKGNAL